MSASAVTRPSSLASSLPSSTAVATPVVTAGVRSAVILFTTALLALMAYYFIGVDEGAMSVFGHSAVVHEFFHDGRHFLGFPCH